MCTTPKTIIVRAELSLPPLLLACQPASQQQTTRIRRIPESTNRSKDNPSVPPPFLVIPSGEQPVLEISGCANHTPRGHLSSDPAGFGGFARLIGSATHSWIFKKAPWTKAPCSKAPGEGKA